MQDNKNKQNQTTQNEQAKTETGKKSSILGDIIEDVVDAVKGGGKTNAQGNTGKKNILGDIIEDVVDAVKKGGKSETSVTPQENTPVTPVQKTAKVRVTPPNKK